jgi:hypothetical protein
MKLGNLNLHLNQTVLPENSVRSDTILTEVNQDVPKETC